MSPRLRGYVERKQVDIPIHIEHLTHGDLGRWIRHFGVNPDDKTVVVVDVGASRADVTIDFSVTTSYQGIHWEHKLTVTGPWLLGEDRNAAGVIAEILSVAEDAVKEGRKASAATLICQAIAQHRKHSSVLRPVVVPVRQEWSCTVKLNDGAPPGPVDIWIRTLESRDVA